MSRKSYELVLLVCLSGWCAAAPQLLEEDAPELPPMTPITELPPDIYTCVGSAANVNECIKNGLEVMKSRLKDGIPELSIPVLDPLDIEQLNVELDTEFGEGQLNLYNLIIQGWSECTVENVNFEIEGEHVQLQLSMASPILRYEGAFEGEMMVTFINVEPSGQLNGNLTGLSLDIVLEGDLSERDGHKYLQLTAIDAESELDDIDFQLKRDDLTNSMIMEFVNSSWRSLYKTALNKLRSIYKPFALEFANAYLEAVPFDLFFDTSFTAP